MARRPVLGGGQEFQEQDPWRGLPEDLYSGPPPSTQSQAGVGGVPGSPDSAAPQASAPSQALPNTLPEPWSTLMYGIQRKGDFQQYFGVVSTQAQLIRKAESRTYFIIQNTSLANQLFVAFGYAPVISAFGATGFVLAPNGGSYEPQVMPQQDVWVLGSAANTTWVIAVCCD